MEKPILLTDWNYTGEGAVGPDAWKSLAPSAAGDEQSPVAILSDSVVYDELLANNPLVVRYDEGAVTSLVNTGHTVQVDAEGDECLLSGGPLGSDVYALKQFHFHWGSVSSRGSEHYVNNDVYSAELHLVHWNRSKFNSFQEALTARGGICVLAVFLQGGADAHPKLDRLCNLLSDIREVDKVRRLKGGFQPADILPEDIDSYWTYEGSLTTPPCHQSVRFIVFKSPIQVSEEQLDQFRQLTGHNPNCHIADNFRPLQPLNGRVITASFRF